EGQVSPSPTLFELGVLPAIDVGKSVSRVGGQAQRAAYRSVTGALKLAYSQFEELESFARFGARLDEHTRQTIEHGRRIRACLKQPELQPIPIAEQIAVLLALTNGLFDTVSLEAMRDAEHAVRSVVPSFPADLLAQLYSTEKLSDSTRQVILDITGKALASFQKPT
ncbi:TPA: F0F1 ATP synthase subunit alpha, partial [Candidatus Sumerlaeota bacterium]|nr:F0F1 ATP synthase subunit alpha [Candidatus Sumerlaeota bacterium]